MCTFGLVLGFGFSPMTVIELPRDDDLLFHAASNVYVASRRGNKCVCVYVARGMRLLERLLVAWNGCNRGYNAFYPLEFACAGKK